VCFCFFFLLVAIKFVVVVVVIMIIIISFIRHTSQVRNMHSKEKEADFLAMVSDV